MDSPLVSNIMAGGQLGSSIQEQTISLAVMLHRLKLPITRNPIGDGLLMFLKRV